MTAYSIVIPARYESVRLPGKMLRQLGDQPLIEHTWRAACASGAERIVVATDHPAIEAAARGFGADVVLTAKEHRNGSERVHEVCARLAWDDDAIVVNLQGDLPTLEPELIRTVARVVRESDADIATLACAITDPRETDDPNVVKCVAALGPVGSDARAHYFSRATVPYGDGPLFHHIGIYAYRRAALERFVALPRSPLETRESLEQLRALEDGMIIRAVHVDTVPLGVDTPRDLETARRILSEARKTEATP